jgi:hypothetical protein
MRPEELWAMEDVEEKGRLLLRSAIVPNLMADWYKD